MVGIKKTIFALLFCFMAANVYSQYEPIETFSEFYTQITLCSYKNNSYVLIVNGYEDLPQYLVVYPDEKYTARQVYGEILLRYYYVKNSKKEYKISEGEWYYSNLDNSEEEVAFFMSLTNSFLLADYTTFFYSDENYSKDELVQFYDELDGTEKQISLGSSAGFLMGIYADDFVRFVRSIK